jgi:Holliday junction resolvasome RuvABC endonuclease subunit
VDAVIVSIDPSSSIIGYAIMAGLRPEQLLDGGLIRPTPAKLGLFERVAQFAQELQAIIGEHEPEAVVFEVSLTSHGRANDRGGAATLGIYGFAVGYLYRVLQSAGVRLDPVEAVEWTGRVKKAKRSATIAALYGRRYDAKRDRGGDLADAIGVGRWWLGRNATAATAAPRTTPGRIHR